MVKRPRILIEEELQLKWELEKRIENPQDRAYYVLLDYSIATKCKPINHLVSL